MRPVFSLLPPCTAGEELQKLLGEAEMADACVLVFANKQDLPKALSAPEIEDKLRLSTMRRPTHVQPACAVTGDGLYEGLDWLSHVLSKRK